MHGQRAPGPQFKNLFYEQFPVANLVFKSILSHKNSLGGGELLLKNVQ